jgi:hypothetical protein
MGRENTVEMQKPPTPKREGVRTDRNPGSGLYAAAGSGPADMAIRQSPSLSGDA